MELKHIVYDLKNSFNVELFRKRALKEGFIEGYLIFSPHKQLPHKNCPSFITKTNHYSQGTLYGTELYISLTSNGDFPDLKAFIESFELE